MSAKTREINESDAMDNHEDVEQEIKSTPILDYLFTAEVMGDPPIDYIYKQESIFNRIRDTPERYKESVRDAFSVLQKVGDDLEEFRATKKVYEQDNIESEKIDRLEEDIKLYEITYDAIKQGIKNVYLVGRRGENFKIFYPNRERGIEGYVVTDTAGNRIIVPMIIQDLIDPSVDESNGFDPMPNYEMVMNIDLNDEEEGE